MYTYFVCDSETAWNMCIIKHTGFFYLLFCLSRFIWERKEVKLFGSSVLMVPFKSIEIWAQWSKNELRLMPTVKDFFASLKEVRFWSISNWTMDTNRMNRFLKKKKLIFPNFYCWPHHWWNDKQIIFENNGNAWFVTIWSTIEFSKHHNRWSMKSRRFKCLRTKSH